MNGQQQNPQQIQIRASDADLKGVYSNVMQITHNREEFVLDFFNVTPPLGVLASRVILSPGHLKRMIQALEENIKRYEINFGNIKPAEAPKEEIGFKA